MYQPKHFTMTEHAAMVAVMQRHPFATLVTHGDDGMHINHLPLLYTETSGGAVLRGHIARGNRLWQRRLAHAVAVFQGPDAYISPSWYPDKQVHGRVVPTWNYQVVHAQGQLSFPEDGDWFASHLRDLVDRFEQPRDDPWSIDDAPHDYLQKMQRGIVGVELVVESLSGKHKASQNKSDEERAGIRAGLEAQGRSGGTAVLLSGLS